MYQHEPSSKDKNSHVRPTLDNRYRAACFLWGRISLASPFLSRANYNPHRVRVVLVSKVPLAGVRTYVVGDRPEGGKWGYGDPSDKTDDNLLDNITVYGKYTCT